MDCISCGSDNIEVLGKVGEKNFSITSNIKVCDLSLNICICNKCGHMQKIHSDCERKYIENFYKNYEVHYLSRGNEPIIYANNGMKIPRSYFALEICMNYFKNKGKLLDIGTGSGTLLKSASKLLKGWSLNACDITDIYKNEILDIEGVENFYNCNVNEIKSSEFDLISMWHVFEHIVDITDLLYNVKRLLKKDGMLLLQIPDSIRNPFDLSVIDHCSHFSNDSLKSLLNNNGFEVVLDGFEWTFNCLTLLLKKTENPVTLKFDEILLKNTFSYINSIIKYFNTETENKDYFMFGAGTSSTCICSQIDRKPVLFIDEDINKHGNYINGIKIAPVSDILENSFVIFPFIKEHAFNLIKKIKKNSNTGIFIFKIYIDKLYV